MDRFRKEEQFLTLIRGLPGSGKSTLADLISDSERAEVVEADMWHYNHYDDKYLFDINEAANSHMWCQMQTERLLRNGCRVVVANTFTTMSEMCPYFNIGKKYGIKVNVIEVNGKYDSIHNVPKDVIDKMISRWESYVIKT